MNRELRGTRLRRALWLLEVKSGDTEADFRVSVDDIDNAVGPGLFRCTIAAQSRLLPLTSNEYQFITGNIPSEADVRATLDDALRAAGRQRSSLSSIAAPATYPFIVWESDWEEINGRPWEIFPDELADGDFAGSPT